MNKRTSLFFFLFLMCSLKSAAQSDSIPTFLKKDSTGVAFAVLPDSVLRDSRTHFSCMLPHTFDFKYFCYLKPETIAFTLVTLNNADFAKADIQNGKPRILFPLKGKGASHFHSKADSEFQKKYGVRFFSKDSVHSEGDDEPAYNEVIFAFLDKQFGKQWRFELRADAIGFNAPQPLIEQALKNLIQGSDFALRVANPKKFAPNIQDPETTSFWWYVLPTSGFALLLSLYFIKRRKK